MRFFTSDMHFGHKKVAGLRGFGQTPEGVRRHDEAIIANWNSVVSPGDTVFVLGDVAMPSTFDDAKASIARLNGTKVLVAGNHDMCSGTFVDGWRHVADYMEAFDSVVSYARTVIRLGDDGRKVTVLLCHYPYFGSDLDGVVAGNGKPIKPTPDMWRRANRYRDVRLPDTGEWLIHGHTHEPMQRLHGGRQIHVGLDAWDMMPVPETTIAGIIRKVEGRRGNGGVDRKRKRRKERTADAGKGKDTVSQNRKGR